MDWEKRRRRLCLSCYKYAILSLLLVVVLLVSTGCAALLIGDNRKAYDLMVKASSYFRYPSSVRIVSGEVVDDSLFCVISARNGLGYDRSDAYFVSSSGYPLEVGDSLCYAKSLNYDLINRALAQHFGARAPSVDILGNLMGGNSMFIIFIYLVVLIVVLCLNGLLASNASDMAYSKGYEKRKWFHMCFWLGPLSYIIIAAMPDQVMRAKQDKTNKLLEDMTAAFKAAAEKQTQDQQTQAREQAQDDVGFYLPEL